MKKLFLAAMGFVLSFSSWAATPTFADRVEETSGTSGTGTMSLAGATTKYRTFVAGVGSGNQTYYLIIHANKPEWEVGIGTVTAGSPDTLSRDSVTIGTNGTSKVNFSAGTKYVSSEITSTLITALGGGGGTVTSVGVSTNASYLTVGSSPVTSTGTITLNKTTGLTANQVVATPDGSTGTADLRALVAADIPNLAASKITSGQLATARGGTGVDGSAATNGQLLIGNGSGYTLATLTAGANVTITNGAGSIQIASSGGGGGSTTISTNAQTGTTYTIDASDSQKLVTFSNASPVAVTLPQAGTGSFTAGYYFFAENLGTGVVTITPTTSTIDGAASITFNQHQGCLIVSDGTNYSTMRGRPTNVDIASQVSGLAANVATFLGTPSSANLAAAVTDETGTGALVFANTPTLVTPILGTPTSGTLTNCTGLPISTGVSGLGAGVATWAATPSSANLITAMTDETGTGALVFANTPTLVTPVLGTPTSGTLSNCTGLPIATGVSGLGAGVATWAATPSSANLISAVTDETGSGALVFATSPTLVTPVLGTPTSGTLTNCTGLPIGVGTTGTLAVDRGGTGQTSYTDGQLLIGNTTGNTLTKTTLTAGSNITITNGSGSITISASSGSGLTVFPAQGRLTLTSTTPVTTSNVTSATIYYALYLGDKVPIYDGSNWTATTFTELSNDTTASSTGKAGPAAVTTNSNYDLFVWSDSGTIRLTRGPLWTSDTSRGTGAGTSELERINGIWMNKQTITNGPAANRGTYVGTVRSDGSSQINDSDSRRCVWNMYNRVSKFMYCVDTTNNWTYTTLTWRAANANTTVGTGRVEAVFGLNENSSTAINQCTAYNTSNIQIGVGVGISSTSANSAQVYGAYIGSAGQGNVMGQYCGFAGLGYQYFQRLEQSVAAGTTTWVGDEGGTAEQTGMTVETKQ